MSDDWKFYPCQMGEHTAFVFFDYGVHEAIDATAPPQLLKVRLAFRQPRDDGLPTNDEFEQLTALEDDLQALAAQHDGLYVGRVTVGGHRYFHIYTPDSDEDWAVRLQVLGARHDYPLSFLLTPDESRDGYWQELFPSEDDWQVIQDLDVLRVLEENGDDGSASRRIDQWAYFPSQSAANEFRGWVQEQGYSVEQSEAAEDGQYPVRFWHEGTVLLPDITSHTIALRRRASELEGSYDGWETFVCKPD